MKNCDLSSSIETSSSTEKPQESTAINYDPYYNCGLVGFGVVQKIPYEVTPTSGYTAIDVNFSSACVKCGLCLVVADKINETLLEMHDSMPSNQWLNEDEVDFLLRVTCNDQFRHYALREIDGVRYIGDGSPRAILVVTTLDGNWENILKKKCHEILDKVGIRELYKQWRDWYEKPRSDLTDFLCRSQSSGLHDCHSILSDRKKSENCRNVYHANIKVMAEFG